MANLLTAGGILLILLSLGIFIRLLRATAAKTTNARLQKDPTSNQIRVLVTPSPYSWSNVWRTVRKGLVHVGYVILALVLLAGILAFAVIASQPLLGRTVSQPLPWPVRSLASLGGGTLIAALVSVVVSRVRQIRRRTRSRLRRFPDYLEPGQFSFGEVSPYTATIASSAVVASRSTSLAVRSFVRYLGRALLPTQVYHGDSRNLSLSLASASLETADFGRPFKVTETEDGEELDLVARWDETREEWVQATLLAAAFTIAGEAKQRQTLGADNLDFVWNCLFHKSGDHQFSIALDMVRQQESGEVLERLGVVEHKTKVVQVANLTKRQVKGIATCAGAVSGTLAIAEAVYQFGHHLGQW